MLIQRINLLIISFHHLFFQLNQYLFTYVAGEFTEVFMQIKVMVKYDGTVFWPPPAKLRSIC